MYELMQLNGPIQSIIAENPDLENLRQLTVEGGMRPLRYAGTEKIAARSTSVDEVLSLTPDLRDR